MSECVDVLTRDCGGSVEVRESDGCASLMSTTTLRCRVPAIPRIRALSVLWRSQS